MVLDCHGAVVSTTTSPRRISSRSIPASPSATRIPGWVEETSLPCIWTERILALPRSAVTEIKALLLAAADRGQDEQELAEREAQHRQLRLLAGVEHED